MPRVCMMGAVLIAGAGALCGAGGTDPPEEPEARHGNPALPGWYADPEGVVLDGRVWIYPTFSAPYNDQLHFDAFSSDDLVNWTKHERILTSEDVWWARRAMWAPALVPHRGRFFLFFAANDIQNDREVGGIGIAVADKPEGPFKDHLGRPIIDRFHNGAQPIDQFVFRDIDGTHYMFYGGWRHCNVVRLNEEFTGLVPFEDGTTYREVTPEGYVEGPFMLRRVVNGMPRYYFMWSEGGWTGPDYSVAYAIADSALGPFKRIGKILEQDPTIATGAGHHSVIVLPGAAGHGSQRPAGQSPEGSAAASGGDSDQYFIVYHRRPLGQTDRNHRVVCIDRLEFDEQGLIKPVKMTFDGVGPVAPAARP
ncbi:MAG: glycoside hydrolase family 43 protein [Phycisphaeraceae bacterium]|nr:glycoside hydrolase family 43 protein [Phycisphaeraceae bacterium]